MDGARPANGQQISGFFYGLLPRIVDLHHQAMRLGGGASIRAFPVISTLLYMAAVLLVVQIVARRSER